VERIPPRHGSTHPSLGWQVCHITPTQGWLKRPEKPFSSAG
jgi:hypothetical protein